MNDSIEGSYEVGAEPNLKIFYNTDISNKIPDKPFTWRYFKNLGITRQAIILQLDRLEINGILRSELRLVQDVGRHKTIKRVYWNVTPTKKK